MQQLNLKKAIIWILYQDMSMRTEIRLLLHEQNAKVVEFGKLRDIHNTLATDTPAALIASVDGQTAGFIKLMSQMRIGEFGRNPFLPTIAVTVDDSQTQWRKLVGAGFNLILHAPFSRQNMWNVVERLYKDNRNFVVTKEYVGPQRIIGGKPERLLPHVIPIPVPNTLEGAANGKPVRKDVIENSFNLITEERVKNAAYMTLAKFESAIQDPDANAREVAKTVEGLCIEALDGITMTSLADAQEAFILSRDFAAAVCQYGFTDQDRTLSLELCSVMSHTVLEHKTDNNEMRELANRVRKRIHDKSGGQL